MPIFGGLTAPKSTGLVWGLAATRHSVCIHQMNWVNSHNDFGHDDSTINTVVVIIITLLPSVLWRCWLGSRKGIWPVKNWLVGCWRGYLFAARCRLAYGPAASTATQSLASVKSRLVLPFWYRLTPGSPGQRAIKRVCVCVYYYYITCSGNRPSSHSLVNAITELGRYEILLLVNGNFVSFLSSLGDRATYFW